MTTTLILKSFEIVHWYKSKNNNNFLDHLQQIFEYLFQEIYLIFLLYEYYNFDYLNYFFHKLKSLNEIFF